MNNQQFENIYRIKHIPKNVILKTQDMSLK